MLRIINILTYAVIVVITSLSSVAFSQNKTFDLTDSNTDSIFMTWNANTPESEMKDDIKALAEKGITIKYSNLKRNSKDQIVGIKVEYADRKGNKGTMELNNQKPINTIKFYKQGDEVGFGEPSNSNQMYAANDFFNPYGGQQDLLKQFNFGNGGAQSFNFSFPNGQGNSKSKIVIKKDGKKPLVIEDGEVIEGGDDYTKEEIEEIKKNNKVDFFDGLGENFNSNEFDFRSQEGLDNFKKQMDKLQLDMDAVIPNNGEDVSKDVLEKTKEDMIKAKEEMIKAKEEMEKAKAALEKAKTSLKTQKT